VRKLVRENAVCRSMKLITLEKLHASLHDRRHQITVETET
jgi:quinolinate synthase